MSQAMPAAQEVLCQLCEDFSSISIKKMLDHAGGWCDNSLPKDEAAKAVVKWFKEHREADDGETVDERQDDDAAAVDELPAGQDPALEDNIPRQDDDEHAGSVDLDDVEIPPTFDEANSEFQEDVLKAVLHLTDGEPGTAFTSKGVNDLLAEHWGEDDMQHVRSRAHHPLATFCDRGIVEDEGRGDWRLVNPSDEGSKDEDDVIPDLDAEHQAPPPTGGPPRIQRGRPGRRGRRRRGPRGRRAARRAPPARLGTPRYEERERVGAGGVHNRLPPRRPDFRGRARARPPPGRSSQRSTRIPHRRGLQPPRTPRLEPHRPPRSLRPRQASHRPPLGQDRPASKRRQGGHVTVASTAGREVETALPADPSPAGRGEATAPRNAPNAKPCTPNNTARPAKGSEVPRDEDDVDQRALAHAPVSEEHRLRAENERLRSALESHRRLDEKLDRLLDQVDDDQDVDAALTDWTLDGFQTYYASRSSSGASTAQQYADALERLERHEHAPVELRPPCEDSWRAHIAWRKAKGQSAHTLNLYWCAMKALLEYVSQRAAEPVRWTSLERSFPTKPARPQLPPDRLVPRFWHHEYFPSDPVKTKLAQYLFRFGFLTGVRPPSELAVLDVQDVDLDARTIRVEQPKKNGLVNVREDEPAHVLTVTNEKSVRNWLTHWRPRLDPTTDALFPKWDGTSWINPDVKQPYEQLRDFLRYAGEKVWPGYFPYVMRHWYATQLMVQTNLNAYAVADRLGDTTATIERHYVDPAKARAGAKSTWQIPRLRNQGGALP